MRPSILSLVCVLAVALTSGCQRAADLSGVYATEEQVGPQFEKVVLDLRSDGTASFKGITQRGDGTGSLGVMVSNSRGNWRVEAGTIVYEAPKSSVEIGTSEPFDIATAHVLRFMVEPNGDLVTDNEQRTRLLRQR